MFGHRCRRQCGKRLVHRDRARHHSTVTVSVDLTGLGRGIYQGSLTVGATGAASQVVPVTLEVGNALPTLCLTPKTRGWGQVKGGTTPSTKSYDVTNVGDDPMANWTSTKTITSGTLNQSATSGTAPKTVSLSVKTGAKKGNQSATLTITAAGAVNGTQSLSLTWTVQ